MSLRTHSFGFVCSKHQSVWGMDKIQYIDCKIEGGKSNFFFGIGMAFKLWRWQLLHVTA